MKKIRKNKKLLVGVMMGLMVLSFAFPAAAGTDDPDATLLTQLIGVVTDVIDIFLAPPLVWFVTLGLVAAGIGIVKGLIPRKRAR